MADKLDLTLDELAKLAKKEKQAENAKKREAAAAAAAAATAAAVPKPTKEKKPTAPKPAVKLAVNNTQASKPELSSNGFNVIVANLNEGLEADELKRIFEQELRFKIKSAEQLKFNGKSHAVRLVFHKKPEADRAVLEFHTRLLDGKEMKVTLQAEKRRPASTAAQQPNKRSRLGPAPQKI
ncbi:hypothetical protein BASA81_007514 [Batrachochytrium salamandrivorans]|nr:hypothetical protein BASA81_007514 [Batrachochytrium salamandrivorans]